MALPFQFANVTTLVTTQIDANYNALGALTPIPCSVSGTNTITLTPLASVPTVAAYSNYMQFTGIAAATNTTTVQAQVGSLTALNVYKDTGSGPVLLTGNEIVASCSMVLLYDSALNAGNGGLHYKSSQVTTTVLTNAVSASASISWPNIPAASSTTSTVVVTGSSVGDCVFLGTPASVPAGITFFGWVNNAGTVTIQALNVTAASITPVAGTYRAVAQRYTP